MCVQCARVCIILLLNMIFRRFDGDLISPRYIGADRRTDQTYRRTRIQYCTCSPHAVAYHHAESDLIFNTISCQPVHPVVRFSARPTIQHYAGTTCRYDAQRPLCRGRHAAGHRGATVLCNRVGRGCFVVTVDGGDDKNGPKPTSQ